jgi:transposase-like protein
VAPRPKKRPPGPERLSSEERAARNREIARRRLEGGSVADVAEEFGVSRNTVKRAARDHVGALRREEEERELTAIRDVDVEALISLGIEAHGVALTRMLELLRGPDGNLVVGAANAVSRLLSSITQNLVRLGVIADPTDEALRRRIEEAERTYAAALVRAADRAGLPVPVFERAMDDAAEQALYAGGLVMA